MKNSPDMDSPPHRTAFLIFELSESFVDLTPKFKGGELSMNWLLKN